MSVIRKIIPKTRPYCTCVLVAAGSSQRMGRDKLSALLEGEPVLVHSLAVLEQCPCIDEVVIVTRAERIPEVAELCRDYGFEKTVRIVCGGETRTASALNGLTEMNRRTEIAAIHDAARPLVTVQLMEEVVAAAAKYLAAAPAIPVKDTIKQHDENNVVTGTPDRSTLSAVQTPQAFHADLIKGALTRALRDGKSYTDDCAAVEAMGVDVHLTAGSEENIKLTTPMDFALAAAILQERERRA